MGMGYLKVQVRTGMGALPVTDAYVVVKDNSGGVLYDMVTDESGDTETISLEAPDKADSLNPDAIGAVYSTYDVEVSVGDKYLPEIINNVQVFDTITAVLPVNMLPTPASGRRATPVQVITIPVNGLELSDERRQEGPVATSRVLKKVNIPEYITVHLGRPAVSAQNVRVEFPDYVKNVASSEIYPTWPEATLEANIYAIITFALNRIYTDWYRSRGYDFDITNTTASDQYYVRGRNIFENISRIVDRIFDTYVGRQGRKEPYFTSFCNGTISTCAGLSQWGTVDQANQGMTPLQILRYYYPSDVQLVTAPVAAIKESYPGTAFREGDQGEDVRIIQNYLNRIRANYPLIPVIPNPNGIFASDTADAVRTFQGVFNLAQDGVVGKSTWFKIFYIYTAVKKLAELNSESEHIDIGANPPNVVLSQGSRGENVTELQFILNYIARFYPTIPVLIEDGTFGTSTGNAVIAFQNTFGLTPDGVVGPATWNRLYEVYKGIREGLPGQTEGVAPSVNVEGYPGTLLQNGSRGESVMLMQRYLNTIAGRYPATPIVSEDGIFGPATRQAVIAFQRRFGLTQDGIIGPRTWDTIVHQYNRPNTGTPTPEPETPSGETYPGTVLQIGSRGNSVQLVQSYLNNISNTYMSIPKLAVDGIFGNATYNAVIAFQRQFGLSQDGKVGPITWNKLIEVYYNRSGATDIPAYPGYLIRSGSRGENVEIIQNALNALAGPYPAISRIAVDGIFSDATLNSVQAFQRQLGLDPDGIVGPPTWERLVTEAASIT